MAADTPSPAHAPDGDRRGDSSAEAPRRVVRVGKYEVVQHIATGGMGAVYRGRDVETGRHVALKIISPETAAKPGMLERFRLEARSASKLKHENIVTVHEIGEVGGAHYLVMEFVDGIDLHDYVRRKGPLDPEEARDIILQGARALEHAAGYRIVHRDVKPSNFILTKKGGRSLVKLTDFGLAREVSAEEFRITRAGTTVGTVDYMAPEQAKNSSSADMRSDLYSLGSTWFHLLTGRAPFPQGGLGERLIKIMTQDPPDARDLNPRISDATWEVLRKLLEKNPRDRYQTPEDLIEAVIALEGRSEASGRSTRKPARKKPVRPSRAQDAEEDDAGTSAEKPRGHNYILLGGLAAILVVCLIAALSMNSKGPKRDPEASTSKDDSGPVTILPPRDAGKAKADDKSKEPIQPVGPVKPAEDRTRWQALYKPSEKIDVAALRAEVEAPWTDGGPGRVNVKVARVARAGTGMHRTLAEALAAAPAGQDLVVEVHDNGPLLAHSLAFEGRNLTLRAGKGYRPLIVWDLPATVERRRQDKKTDQPLVFLTARKSVLRLEGLELAMRWPDALTEPVSLLDLGESELDVRDCTLSSVGRSREPLTLVRFRTAAEGARCRFTRTYIRGAGMTALDLEAPGGQVLLDGCLVVGGVQPLIRVRSDLRKGPRLRLVRSTLIGTKTLVELKPAAEVDRSPLLDVLAWDCLLSRGGQTEGGALLALADGSDARGVEWRAVNALYAGWKDLLAGRESIRGDRSREWRQQWKRIEGDESLTTTWPEQPAVEPGNQPASLYQPIEPLSFSSTVDPNQRLGCDLSRLAPCRDAWQPLSIDPVLAPIEVPSDNSAPEIPNPGDGMYHGGRIDLTSTDLGAVLAKTFQKMKPGPRIVLHLTGKGEHSCSPIRLKGSSLVLFFEEPPDEKTARTALRLSSPDASKALIDVEEGNVEVTGGVLRLNDAVSARGSHLIRVKGGDVKLYRTKLDGPHNNTPGGWQAAVALTGSGDPAADKAHTCALNECLVLSSKAGVVLEGVGCRLALQQSLVVAGTDALVLQPGPGCKDRASMQVSLQRTTLAARGAIVRLGDAPVTGILHDPVLIQSRDCAFLEPFAGSRGGLLVYEGQALSRGLLLWQGEQNVYDQRLFFAAHGSDTPLPERREGLAAWRRLWGSYGEKHTRPEVSFLSTFDPKRWVLERLILRLPGTPGADLAKLGIGKGKR